MSWRRHEDLLSLMTLGEAKHTKIMIIIIIIIVIIIIIITDRVLVMLLADMVDPAAAELGGLHKANINMKIIHRTSLI